MGLVEVLSLSAKPEMHVVKCEARCGVNQWFTRNEMVARMTPGLSQPVSVRIPIKTSCLMANFFNSALVCTFEVLRVQNRVQQGLLGQKGSSFADLIQ